EERGQTRHLAAAPRPRQQAGDAATEALAERVEPHVRLRRQRVQRRDTGGHRHRVRVEGAAVADPGATLARVVEVHDVASAAEGADGQAAADDLAEGREIGPDAEPLLGAAPGGAE